MNKLIMGLFEKNAFFTLFWRISWPQKITLFWLSFLADFFFWPTFDQQEVIYIGSYDELVFMLQGTF